MGKDLLTREFRLAFLIVLFMWAPGGARGQTRECYAPISKYRLLEQLLSTGKKNGPRPKSLPIAELIARINRFGVSFQMSPADEQEIRAASAGRRPTQDTLADLIKSVRAGYKSKFVVLIADIENDQYDATREIYEQLAKATEQFPEVCVDRLNETITAPKDKLAGAMAAEKAGTWNANIVIYGRLVVNERKARVHLSFKPVPQSQIPLNQEEETLTAQRAELQDFVINEQLSKQMVYLTLLTVGIVRYELGDLDGAIECFDRGLKDPIVPTQIVDAGVLHFYKSVVFDRKGLREHKKCNYKQAVDYYDAAITEGNTAVESLHTAEAFFNLGTFYYNKWDISKSPTDREAAIKSYNQAIDAGKVARAYYNLGNIHRESNDDEAALQDYRLAYEADPKYAAAYNNRGNIYKDREEYEQALSHYKRAIEAKNDYPDPHVNCALVHFNTRDYPLVVSDLDKAIQLISDCKCLGTSDATFTSFLNNTRSDPDRNIVTGNITDPCKALGAKSILAFLYRLRGRARVEDFRTNKTDAVSFDGAIRDFSASIEAAPHFYAYHYRAHAYSTRGVLDKAEEDFIEAIRLNKAADESARNTLAIDHLDLSDVLILRRKYYDAITHCDATLASGLTSLKAPAYINRGEAYYGLGARARGLADIKEGLQLLTNEGDVKSVLRELTDRFSKEIVNELEHTGLRLPN